MKCREFESQLHDYFLDTLSAAERTRLGDHAATCEACGALMQTAKELPCRKFVEFLNDYLDDDLAEGRKAVFERHLAICADCTSYLDSYRRTRQLSMLALASEEGLVPADPPDELVRAVLDSLNAAHKSPRRGEESA